MNGRWIRVALIAAVGISVPTRSEAVQSPRAPKLIVHNAQRVYHPSVLNEQKAYRKVGAVTSRKVFDATAEYKAIQKRKLSPKTAEWNLLVKAASDKFKTAVSRTASAGGYDVIAETGAVAFDEGAVPDITSDILSHLAD